MIEDNYKDEYCQKLIDHMKEGRSFRTFVKVTMCCRQTMYNWVGTHKEFARAKSIGEDLAMDFFESNIIEKAEGKSPKKDLGANLFPLKTRFHEVYGDRHKVEQNIKQESTIRIEVDEQDL